MITFTPLVFAALAAWVMCVCFHEFSHALVAYWGGDRSVREKGYLSLDPTRFIDPVFSLLIPAIILLIGGFPLPGASVMINRGALKSERWAAYVSAAGPASNFLLFLIFAIPLHPWVGMVDPTAGLQPTWVYFCGAMCVLNFIVVLFNLIPVPPLDGFGIIEHTFDPETRMKLRQPQVVWACFAMLMFVLFAIPGSMRPFVFMLEYACDVLGLSFPLLIDGYRFVLFDEHPLSDM